MLKLVLIMMKMYSLKSLTRKQTLRVDDPDDDIRQLHRAGGLHALPRQRLQLHQLSSRKSLMFVYKIEEKNLHDIGHTLFL